MTAITGKAIAKLAMTIDMIATMIAMNAAMTVDMIVINRNTG